MVWARVPGPRDWAPGWIIETPEAHTGRPSDPDVYRVKLFGTGARLTVADSHAAPGVVPFDQHPPHSAATTTGGGGGGLVGDDGGHRIAALRQALTAFFPRFGQRTREAVLQWRGRLRMILQLLGAQDAASDEYVTLEMRSENLQAAVEEATGRHREAESELQLLRPQVQGFEGIGERLAALNAVEAENLRLQQQVGSLTAAAHRPASPPEPRVVEGPRPEEMAALAAQLDQSRGMLAEATTALQGQASAAVAWQQRCAALTAQLVAAEVARRRLEGAVLDLRGGLRVMGRVRPPAATEGTGHLHFPADDTLRMAAPGWQPLTVKLDRVFPPHATNADVFAEAVAPLVQRVVDGRYATVLAYGATGSGKTWTLQGPGPDGGTPGEPDHDAGLLIRAVALVLGQPPAAGWERAVAAEMMEVRQERVYDLLAATAPAPVPDAPAAAAAGKTPTRPYTPLRRPSVASMASPASRRPSMGSPPPPPPTLMSPPSPSPQRMLYFGPSSGPRAPGPPRKSMGTPTHAAVPEPEPVVAHPVASVEGFRALLATATARRAPAGQAAGSDPATRSHFVCVVTVTATNAADQTATQGRLTVADLAGSEPPSRPTGATGAAAAAAGPHCDRSLQWLRTALVSGAERSATLRNSALTRLLSDSFGPRAKVLTLVTLSPAVDAARDTSASLRFAREAHGPVLGPTASRPPSHP